MSESGGGDASASAVVPEEAALSAIERRRDITDFQVINLAEETATDWRKIARRLPDVSQPGAPAFKLNDQRLKTIEKSHDDDEERMISVLQKWIAMRSSHTWGALWDTLYSCGYGRAARNVFGELQKDRAAAEQQYVGEDYSTRSSDNTSAAGQTASSSAESQVHDNERQQAGTMPTLPRNQLLKVIDQLSKDFTHKDKCDSFAIYLELSSESRDFVEEFRMQNPNDRENFPLIAKTMMKKWISNRQGVPARDCLEDIMRILREDLDMERSSEKCLQWWERYAGTAS